MSAEGDSDATYTLEQVAELARQIEAHIDLSRNDFGRWSKQEVLDRLAVVEPLWQTACTMSDSVEQKRELYLRQLGPGETVALESRLASLKKQIGISMTYLQSRPVRVKYNRRSESNSHSGVPLSKSVVRCKRP